MEKVKLTRFIDKYHLGGNVNAVVINSKSNKLSTRFITGDKALLGELTVNNFTFEDIVERTEKALKSGASNETLDDVIDDLARQRYEYDPAEMIIPYATQEAIDYSSTTFAIGHPDYGYRIFVDGKDKTPSNTGQMAYNSTEAEIQLRDAMLDEGYDLAPIGAYDAGTQYKQFMEN